MKKRLYFIPYAGASGTTFKNWKRIFGDEVDFVILELPGHGSQCDKELCTKMSDACEVLYQDILNIQQKDNMPFFIAGHCLGAIIANEIIYKIRGKREIKMPVRLFISGHGSPDMLCNDDLWADLSDEELTKALMESGGMDESMAEQEILAMTLPIIRSDAMLYEGYEFDTSRRILPIEMTIIYTDDDKKTNETTLNNWKNFTTKEIMYIKMEGSHYFINEHTDDYINNIKKVMDDDIDKIIRKRGGLR